MLRVLLVSDSPTFNTGYAVTLRKVAQIFQRCGCDVRQLAWGLTEDVQYSHHLYKVKKDDYYGKTSFKEVVDDFLPHIVFSFGDLGTVGWIGTYPNRFFKWWAYFPIDAEHLTVAQAHVINLMDMPITYSKTGMNVVIGATHREDTKVIYHGIDTELFKPVDNKELLKRRYNLQGKFIVGSVGRNNARKNFPALIKAFADFSKDKDDTYLYLHTAPIDVGHNLYEHVKRFGIGNKTIITQNLKPATGVEVQEVVETYNLFDVFVSSTTGEGFGLPILEAQSCGVPTFVTDYSACAEFVPKNFRIKTCGSYYEPFWDLERKIVDHDDLVDKLNRMYYNRGILEDLGKQARRYVEDWDWKNIEPLFEYLIREYGFKELPDQEAMSGFFML